MKLSKEQWTLGQLIDALAKESPGARVVYDFPNAIPDQIRSYRGCYEDLAIGFCAIEDSNFARVGSLLQELRNAVGQAFNGYKGGQYTATRSAALWVSQWGNTSHTIIVGVTSDEQKDLVVIQTKWLWG